MLIGTDPAAHSRGIAQSVAGDGLGMVASRARQGGG